MHAERLRDELEIQVWECLDNVTDPELDEPVTDMGFIELVEVSEAKRVRVEFRLPTYWCSPNFAFLMAFGIRKQVLELPWVHDAQVHLNDHCFGEKVNEGVNSGRDYHVVFAEYCDGADLEEVAEKFLHKAFQRRQETVLLGLQQLGKTPDAIVGMTLGELMAVQFTGDEECRQRPRYLDLLTMKKFAVAASDRAFCTWDGVPIPASELKAHLGRLRSTRINMEFNGALCRGLAKTRYKEVEIGPDGPTLVDFIAGRVPPQEESVAQV